MTDKPTDPNAAVPTAPEASAGGPANLDALLKEFDSPAAKPESKPASEPLGILKELAPVIRYAKNSLAKEEAAEIDTSIKSAVSFVKEEEALKDTSESLVRKVLNTTVAEDPKLSAAWNSRHADPAGWNAALKVAREMVKQELAPLTEKRVPSDVLAARAAISGGVSTGPADAKGPTPDQMFRMSERDWADYKRQAVAQARG